MEIIKDDCAENFRNVDIEINGDINWRNQNSQLEQPGNLKFCAPFYWRTLIGQKLSEREKKEKEQIKNEVKSVYIGYSG